MARHNGKATDDTAAPTGTKIVDFDAIVREGKQIVAELRNQERRSQLRLGQLADKVETHYSKRDLARFAAEIGTSACTLRRYRDVYRAWDGAGISAPGRVSYSVMRALETHPRRGEIVSDNPNLTKAQAGELMNEFNGKPKVTPGSPDSRRKEYERWLREVMTLVNDAVGKAAFKDQPLTPAARKILGELITPPLVKVISEAAKELSGLAAFLDRLADDEAGDGDEASHVKTEDVIDSAVISTNSEATENAEAEANTTAAA
jgi:hypothetical protein